MKIFRRKKVEKEKIELIKFDEVGYFESADAVYAQRAEVEQLAMN